jgi:FKBP-type peptidyl-prolyl cis-trans isomerase FklB
MVASASISDGKISMAQGETMNRLFFVFLALALMLVPACSGNQKKDVKIETDKQKISYALGVDIGTSLSQSAADLDFAVVAKGLSDSASGADLAMTPEDMQAALSKLQQEMQAEQQKRMQEQIEQMQAQMNKTIAAGKAYLEENAKREGVKTLPSGLQFEVIVEGEGPQPGSDDVVEINYKGELVNGTVFDSSYDRNKAAVFPVKGVIPGFSEGLQLMKEGGKARMVIPPDLAYGDRQAGPEILPGSTLVFEVEMLNVKKPSN